ncbi:hypothetical protein HJC23_004017 [Cyclotella cryptica]|uniref:Uncharacterized protein n=1 Tax=Cyclotella cryptica TaxID=29204 RepID=A0ABD3QUE5_9STRA
MTTNDCKLHIRTFFVAVLLILSASWRLYDEIIATKNNLRTIEPIRQYIHSPSYSRFTPPKNCLLTQQYPKHFVNYTAPFIPPSQWMEGEGDIYSGMWWQSIDSMMGTNYSKLGFLEAVSLKSFQNNERVIQTVDWLDLAVEHLSKYVKYFARFSSTEDVSTAVEDRVAELLEAYIKRTSCREDTISSSFQSAIPSTIAILPLRVTSLENQYDVRFLRLQLTATLASLWAAGFPRAVVVGVSHNESVVSKEAFGLLKAHLKTSFMELQYVQLDTNDLALVPKAALANFQKIIAVTKSSKDSRANNAEIADWLGNDNPSKWKYIYFTEPDLILHLRPEAIRSLSIELEKNHILNAHRLQPLPHMKQFSDIVGHVAFSHPKAASKFRNKVLPDQASFAALHPLDPSSGDVCCDQGKFYPSHLDDPTSPAKKGRNCWLWEFCGFLGNANASDWNAVVKRHNLLVLHPLLLLDRGTRIPLVHHGQRVCTPRRDGAVCLG